MELCIGSMQHVTYHILLSHLSTLEVFTDKLLLKNEQGTYYIDCCSFTIGSVMQTNNP